MTILLTVHFVVWKKTNKKTPNLFPSGAQQHVPLRALLLLVFLFGKSPLVFRQWKTFPFWNSLAINNCRSHRWAKLNHFPIDNQPIGKVLFNKVVSHEFASIRVSTAEYLVSSFLFHSSYKLRLCLCFIKHSDHDCVCVALANYIVVFPTCPVVRTVVALTDDKIWQDRNQDDDKIGRTHTVHLWHEANKRDREGIPFWRKIEEVVA